MTECSVDGCAVPVLAKGLCSKHYQRYRTHGSTGPRKGVGTPLERFHLAVKVNDETGCWEWTNYLDEDGYGSIKVSGKDIRAHRFSYEAFVGPIPEGLVLDHLCRNRCCVNPDHLEPVTWRENVVRGETVIAANLAKVYCIRGHELSGENVSLIRGRRECKACQRYWNRKQKGIEDPEAEYIGRWPSLARAYEARLSGAA